MIGILLPKNRVFPKIGGKPPKMDVFLLENPIKMDDLGGKPTIFGNIHMAFYIFGGIAGFLPSTVPHVTILWKSCKQA